MKRCTVIDMESFKRLAKILSRRVDVRHTVGLDQLSIASGYPNWNVLRREYEKGESGAPIQRSSVDPHLWMEQVVEVFGASARDALSGEELLVLYQRAFGTPTQSEENSVDTEDSAPETQVASSGKAGAPTVVITYSKHRRLQER